MLRQLCAALFLFMLACAATTASAAPRREIAWSPYVLELRSGDKIPAELGSLVVPATRRTDDGATLTLRFVRLRGNPDAGGPPIIYLAGGPGSSGIEAGRGDRSRMFERLRDLGDVILLDQRGTGLSSPPPVCSRPWAFPASEIASETSIVPSFEDGLRRCAAEWRSAGVRLEAYNTADNAADVADLVRALGVPKVRLVGISYGTFLGFAVLRDFGELIDRAVFAGTEGPDHTIKLATSADRALTTLAEEFAEEAPNDPSRADLDLRVRKVFDRLASGAVTVEVDGKPTAVSKFDAQFAVAFLMGTSENAVRLPDLLSAMESGDFGPLASTVQRLRGFYGAFPAMAYAMDGASGSSPTRKRAAEAAAGESSFGNAVNFPTVDLPGALGIETLADRYWAPLRTGVPALFISGTLDWRTPPAQAEEVRRGFRESAHLVLDGAGHDNDLFLSSPVILDRIEKFFLGRAVADETVDVDLLAGD